MLRTAGLYAQISLPQDPSGTATYTAADNLAPTGLRSVVTHKEMSTTTTKDQSPSLLPKPRVLGLHPGSAWTSEDFDAPLGGELGFGDE